MKSEASHAANNVTYYDQRAFLLIRKIKEHVSWKGVW